MAALLYCLRGVQATYAARSEDRGSATFSLIEDIAIPALQEALRLKPGHVGAQERLERLEALGLGTEAMQHYSRGVTFVQEQQWDEAIQEFEAALKSKPDFAHARENLAIAHANRGLSYEQAGLVELALQDARLAVQMGFGQARKDVARLEAMAMSSSKDIDAAKEKCFIATAAYGSESAPDVVTLRRFRDVRLACSRAGRSFIALYARFSPQLAAAVARRPTVRRLVQRVILRPAVWLAKRWTQ